MIPDYDRVMAFLANTELAEIVRIVAHPQELEAELSRNYSEPEDVEPDTPEAAELATADGERDDRAETRIERLLRRHPQTWATFKQTVHRLAPGSSIAAYLEDFRENSMWSFLGPDEEEEDEE